MEQENVQASVALSEEDIALAKKKKLQAIWDKVTTGILIFLMASPLLILAYIFAWFVFRNF